MGWDEHGDLLHCSWINRRSTWKGVAANTRGQGKVWCRVVQQKWGTRRRGSCEGYCGSGCRMKHCWGNSDGGPCTVPGSRTEHQAGSILVCDRLEGEERVSAGLDTPGQPSGCVGHSGKSLLQPHTQYQPQLDLPWSVIFFLSKTGMALLIPGQPRGCETLS